MNYKIHTDFANKERNAILFFHPVVMVIDPQASSIPWIIHELGSIPDMDEIIIVLSHEHENHYSGLEELLARISGFNPGVTIIAPAGILTAIPAPWEKNFTVIEVEPTQPVVIWKDENNPDEYVEFRRAFGHCSRMITVHVYSQDSQIFFLSDNLCTNFPPPITDGGEIKKMIHFYELLLKEIADAPDLVLLPGHGVSKGRQHLEALLQYYQALPQIQWTEVAAELKDQKFAQIGEIFHQLNRKASQE